ncbi:MAG: MFS transporter [Syntrophorhabdaceae bacterium]|nr:MFS transporter [Syntrophorhabdaceae bacterium]
MSEKTPYSPYRWLILTVCCFALIAYAIDMIVYAPIFGEVAGDLMVDMGTAINLSMAFALAVAVAMMFGGMIVDRCGLTFVFVLGLACASLPATLMPWIGHSYTTVFIARLLQGVVAIIFAAIGPILALWFPQKEHGIAGGLMMCSLSIGPAVGVIVSPEVFLMVGTWQKTVAILSLPGWVAMILAVIITRRPPDPGIAGAMAKDAGSPAGRITYGKIFAMPMTWVGTFIAFFNSWGIYSLYNLIPPYFATASPTGVGLGPVAAGKLSLVLVLAGIPAFISGGIFFDRVAKGRHRPAIFIGFVMTGIFTYLLLLPAVYQNTTLLVVCLVIAGWGMSFMAPTLSAFIATNYPPSYVGSMMGWWFGFGTFGGALGTYLAAVATRQSGTFYWALTPISLAACAGFILGFFLKSRRKGGTQQ